MPARSDIGSAFARDAFEFELDDTAPGHAAETGLDHAIAVEDERCGSLEHLKLLRKIWAIREVDIQMGDTRVIGSDAAEVVVHRRAARAKVGAELQQRGLFAERSGTDEFGVDDSLRNATTRPALGQA